MSDASSDEEFVDTAELLETLPEATVASHNVGLLDFDGVDPKHKRRAKLPAPKNNEAISFWSVMKNSIGKDLSRIAMPVNFNEPVSFLQRLCEDLEYSELLDKAADEKDPLLRITYIAAFSVSAYSTTHRSGKPFNPLLGETYELVYPEGKWRFVAEQVSHHPPVTAMHCESEKWIFWQDYKLDSKFRGQYLKVTPQGVLHLKLKTTGEHYTWKKPETTIHNIILGSLWIDHEGERFVYNHNTGDRCRLKFTPYSESYEYFRMEGSAYDKDDVERYRLGGRWDDGMYAKKVVNGQEAGPEIPMWKLHPRPSDSAAYYGMTSFTMMLNERVPGMIYPLTDCRFRPDQRFMEEGLIDEAADEKLRLEEKQRTARSVRQETGEVYHPRWFIEAHDPDSDTTSWVYRGGYWEEKKKGQFTNLPDIY
eukprot:Colp12_sorted_trinity150504_noHs@28951